MSSSAGQKAGNKKSSRVGPPVESRQLKDVKGKQRADQQARTDALVDLYEVGRAQVLHAGTEATSAVRADIDLSEQAGPWKGARRPFGLVLTRGVLGELLLISESTSNPGEWVVKYDAPFPDVETPFNPE
jgi:hypothetical protein